MHGNNQPRAHEFSGSAGLRTVLPNRVVRHTHSKGRKHSVNRFPSNRAKILLLALKLPFSEIAIFKINFFIRTDSALPNNHVNRGAPRALTV